MAAGCLLDTNILLRLSRRGDAAHLLIRRAVHRLLLDDAPLFYCPQNLVEMWSVLTRPVDRNGFGLSLGEAEDEVRLVERGFTLLPDNEMIHPIWRRLVNDPGVRGRQVHDARLVAVMRVHGVSNLLTLNRADFLRYGDIVVIDPGEAPAGI